MTPDPAFLEFFAGPFQRLLDTTKVPGMEGASWDRRAAWLLWLASDKGKTLQSSCPPPSPTAGVFD